MSEFDEHQFGLTRWSNSEDNAYRRRAVNYLENKSDGSKNINRVGYFLPDQKYGEKIVEIIEGEGALDGAELKEPNIQMYEFVPEKFNLPDNTAVYFLDDGERCALAGEHQIVENTRQEIIGDQTASEQVDSRLRKFWRDLRS